jgi:hypothetical protein
VPAILLLFVGVTALLHASSFNLIKKENNAANVPTLLVIAGIHGNEPGSYFAAALLSRYYQIKQGNLWIVPDLNRESIQQNSRGIHGDMNRKFSTIDPKDPDFEKVTEIKKIITQNQIGLILNLHDGHGFYRKEHLNTIFNPNAWGQTFVIDQGTLDSEHPFGNLNEIASKVSKVLNEGLIERHHLFDVRNTNTRFDDETMKHSLTYFAVSNQKPAFAIETSKNLPSLHHKVFYQLRAIESYMNIMGIHYERSFDLNLESLKQILKNYDSLTINNNFYLNLQNLKNILSFIPLKSGRNEFKFNHPLGSVQKIDNVYNLYIGNVKVGTLVPSYHQSDNCSQPVNIVVDGQEKKIDYAKDFFVMDDFKVINKNLDFRVNVIGFTQKGVIDESERVIRLKDLDPRYSIDTLQKSYRVEFYRENRFCGMVLAHFK